MSETSIDNPLYQSFTALRESVEAFIHLAEISVIDEPETALKQVLATRMKTDLEAHFINVAKAIE